MTEGKKPLKVAIIGKAPSSRLLAPYEDDSWEIWSLSDNHTVVPRWDRWFELHELKRYKESYPPYYDWLAEDHGKPKYTSDPCEELPDGVQYPIDEIVSYYQPFGRYWTNSIALMAALALYEGCTSLGFWGVDMAQSQGLGNENEYAWQRPSCEWIIGAAWGRGVEITVPPESDLMKTRFMYAFETHRGEFFQKLRARDDELKDRINKLNAEKNLAERQTMVAEGALAEVGILESNTNGEVKDWVEARRKMITEQGDKASKVRAEKHDELMMLIGARENCKWVRQYT